MARFAQYYIKYHHEFAPYDWEKRQEHLGALFEKDESITFGVGEPSEEQRAKGEQYAKTYNHRVYHLQNNPAIIVMQFANSIDIPVEKNFGPDVAKDEPSCFVIIDIPCHPEFKAERLVLNGEIEVQNCTKDCPKELTERQKVILDIIAEDCTITAQKIAQKNIKLGQRTLMKELSDLKKVGVLTREGGRKDGVWIVIKKEQ